jgi:Predicted hydrolases or acyltransferases (alpha/beta hydrolase superfamily)
MDHFGIQKSFALGTSQGGWIVTRMALLAPDRVSPRSCTAEIKLKWD